MREFLHLLCIFLILITSGNALKCRQCNSETGASCFGPFVTCTSLEDTCISKYFEIINSSTTEGTRYFSRSCGNVSSCDQIHSLKSFDLKIQIKTSCCNTDFCDPPRFMTANFNTTENGVMCPVCYSRDYDTCTHSTLMACQGPETKCMTVIISSASISLDGIVGKNSWPH